jgi:hypothetical protein
VKLIFRAVGLILIAPWIGLAFMLSAPFSHAYASGTAFDWGFVFTESSAMVLVAMLILVVNVLAWKRW